MAYDDDYGDDFIIPDDVAEAFMGAKVQETPPEDGLPNGTYSMVIEKANPKMSRKGTPMFVWQLRVLGPRYAGTRVWKNSYLTTNGMDFFKTDITNTGVELDNIYELESKADEFIDKVIEVQVLHSKTSDFVNYNVKRLLATDVAEWSDDGIPF